LLALLAEKAFVLRSLDIAREDHRRINHSRTGLFVKSENFCAFKLGKLLQDLAFAKLKELRLLSFIAMIEEKLRHHARTQKAGAVSIGSAPANPPRARRHLTGGEAFVLAFAALKLQR
jgi:hypothetical protein